MANKSIKKIDGYPLMDEKNRTDIKNFKVECDEKFNNIAAIFQLSKLVTFLK